ncbi:hypothetical protein KZC56_17395 [Microbacterium sp. SSW1-47]|uniref:hypothetical protein n=1 Tax=Microbacterium sufflavum TaxID=2851649 RepID=UPI001FFCC027|nr:hypothetical protein [Microbacterium sufflavum]MCK2028075.1 hypothetical protein [Microbacterium sufflavum]
MDSITLHAKSARHQVAAAEAARESGINVLYDPRTERMADLDPDGQLTGLSAYGGTQLDIHSLASSSQLRHELVDRVLNAHPAQATIMTPPAFFIDSERTARLAVDLAEATRLATTSPVRPVLFLSSRLSITNQLTLASELVAAGITQVDLRVSPFSGENDSIRKIRQTFATVDRFRDAGLTITLGHSGNIGQVAVALGHASSYSVGIGQNEHVDFKGTLRRQVNPPKKKRDENGKTIGGGSWEGIYLPGLAVTVSRRVGEALLDHSDIRTRIGCRIDGCATALKGPLNDSKVHYLHARAAEMEALESKPAQWRAKIETDRLTRALELRNLVNDKYREEGQPALKTRTLSSLLEGIREEREAAA